MFGDIVGFALISSNPSPETTLYPFGPLSDLAGKTLRVLERNRNGDCLCIVNSGAIADVSAADVEAYFQRGKT